ncbi:purine-binding chemotaxis protein CheW [Labrys sp. KNU-23]|uniref:chemotaxis protein CheW n=1 Tax=Labrys sp. KNU-23 TaxID=2789216 RepID=UPI0011ED373C|nr:chemotaxis protein CheW [Labrys sp. KNU-23]QEN85477.1 purine-binding chemotaxis protein CheW [Labrys sp. KNU-23]
MTSLASDASAAASPFEIDNCWQRIGVRGDKSCPELRRHAHCHNCEVFSRAASRLLDRDIPAGGMTSALPPAGAGVIARSSNTQSVLVFRLGSEWFALPTLVLDEVTGLRPIHSLPHRRNPALLGLVNVRGELVICVSIAQILIGAEQHSPQGRLIVAHHAGSRLAFPVDEVQYTHLYGETDLKPVPATVAHSSSGFTRGLLSWRDRNVGRLDEHALFEVLGRGLAR